MGIQVKRHANISKQATLLDGLDVGLHKWGVCGCGLNRFVHEGMNHISNVKVHLKFSKAFDLSFKDSQWKCKYSDMCSTSHKRQ